MTGHPYRSHIPLSWALALFLCLCSALGMAQNLVPNGGFEEYDSLPDRDGVYSVLRHWQSASGKDSQDLTYGTPDYFHVDAVGTAKAPLTGMGTVIPFGKGVMGLVTFNEKVADFREYVLVPLSKPLQKGATYWVSYWVCNGISNQYGKLATPPPGISFSTKEVVQPGHSLLSYPDLNPIQTVVYSTTWQEIAFSYTPDSVYRFLLLGNFRADEHTTSEPQRLGRLPFAYYFIDSVSVLLNEEPPAATIPNPCDSLFLSFDLQRVQFLQSQAVYVDEAAAEEELRQILDVIQSCPDFTVQVIGHTDNRGSRTKKLELSQDRAELVMSFFLKQRIPQRRISAKGVGSSRPRADNRTEEGRKQNRRVEITLQRE